MLSRRVATRECLKTEYANIALSASDAVPLKIRETVPHHIHR